jgi:APA family basic amino acid/polyamine antiporter
MRVLGLGAGISLVAGSMLGIGIFLTPPLVASHLPSAPWFFGLWGLVGLVALAGAVSYAELGAMMPRAGGDYVFLREAYGPSLAFASGWVIFGAVFTGSIASLAVPVCQYQLPALLGSQEASWVSGAWLGLPRVRWLAVGLIVLVTGVNALGARVAGWLQGVTTAVPALLFGAGALWALLGSGVSAPAASAPAAWTLTAGGVAASYAAVYFAYSGWNAVIYVAGEVKAPERTLPWSLTLGTLGIMALYGLLCGAFWVVLGPEGLRGAGEAGTATATALGGTRAGWWATLLIGLGLLGTLNGTVLGGARVAMAMAEAGAFWGAAARRDARGVPQVALWVQCAWACAMVWTGTFERIVSMVSVAMLLIGSLTVSAVFVLRWRAPERARPYRVTGYPWAPGLYVVANLAVVVVMIGEAAREGGWEGWFPMLGVVLFLVVWGGHARWAQRSR